MLISVDLPAPFSPRSACTSPRRRSKSMWSLASTPGNCFVIPRSSRTGASSTRRLNNRAGPQARSAEPLRQVLRAWRDRRRRLELAGDDLCLQLGDLSQPGLLEVGPRAELAQRDALVLQVEDEVASTLEALTRLGALNGEEDADVHPLHCAREDVRAEERLVDVDADRPLAGLLRGVQRPEAARTGDAEHDLRAGVELVLRDALALRLIDEVLRVADLDGRARNTLLCARLVAGEERVDRRDLDAADDADVLLALPRCDVRREAADQVAVLLCRVRQALDVR